MVTIIGFKKTRKDDGTEFNLLELNGGIEFVKSKETERLYATMRKCFISSTFDDEVCISLIGTKLDGNIVKVTCEPYEFVNKITGEIMKLDFRHEYLQEEKPKVNTNQVMNGIESVSFEPINNLISSLN